MKHCIIDVETCGLDPEKNGIVQIAGQLFVHGELVSTFKHNVRPLPQDEIDEKALEISGFTKDEVLGFTPAGEVYGALLLVLNKYVNRYKREDKIFFVGFNATFDDDHLRAFFVKHAETEKDKKYGNYYGSYFFWPPLDVAVLAAEKLKDVRHEMENFKLETVASGVGIALDVECMHDAGYDVEVTRRLYEWCQEK